MSVSVIASRCVGDRGKETIWGDCLVDARFSSLEEAMIEGKKHCGRGMSVIVRPNYNEQDERGGYYREWRSFHGEAFKECRWATSLKVE